jgi:hypothetical protein
LGCGLPNLLPVTFSVPCCHLPFLYLEQIYGILPTSISPSTSVLQHGPASSHYFFGDLRIVYLATWWAHYNFLKIPHRHKITRCPHCIYFSSPPWPVNVWIYSWGFSLRRSQ